MADNNNNAAIVSTPITELSGHSESAEDSVNLLSNQSEITEVPQPDITQEHEFPVPTATDTSSETDDASSNWNWLSNLHTRIKSTNDDLRSKIVESNKALEEKIQTSNKLIEEKFQEGFEAFTSAPSRAAGTIRRRHNELIEQKENQESEHWKHERKLITKFECLDYTQIYNKAYRRELYLNFFNVRGNYEWLRWILSAVIGIIIGFIAWASKVIIKKSMDFKFEVVGDQLAKGEIQYYVLAYFIYIAFNVPLAFLSSVTAVYWEPTASGSGIPEVKAYLNGTKIPHFLRLRTLFGKFASMVLANIAGLPLGTEGPMIHIGALIGNAVSQAQSKELQFKIPFMKHFRNDRDKRDFITSGVGAGVAAAFGAPLGGTLFSLEEVASFWSTLLTWRTFFTCMVAVFAGELFMEIQSGVYQTNGLMIFNVGSTELAYRVSELIPFAIIGVIGGLLGSAFSALHLAAVRMRAVKINTHRNRRVLEIAAIALFLSTCQFMIPFAFHCKDLPEGCLADAGSMSLDTNVTTIDCEILKRHHCPEGQYNDLASIIFSANSDTVVNLLKVGFPHLLSFAAVLIFFIYYFVGSSYTSGGSLAAGLFVPMVVVGAAYGRLVGLILVNLYGSQFKDVGIFAIVGTAAFMAGLSRLTVSLTVIIIEITNDLANLLPIMLAVMIAKLVADSINHPLFDSLIEFKHIPYLEPNPSKEMKILMCKHIMAPRPKYFTEKDTVGNIMLTLKNTTHNGYPVVNNRNSRFVKGIILRAQLLVILDKLSKLWISRSDTVYSHEEYQTKLAWNLPRLQDIPLTEEDYDVEIDLTPYMNLSVYSVNEEFAVSEAFLMFRTMGLRHLLVVGENNRLKGMITKKDLMEHSCTEKYKELKRLKKMNIDLPLDQEIETVPGTPAEPGDPTAPVSIREALRRHLSSSSLLTSSQSFISRNLTSRATSPTATTGPISPRVEYAIDPDVSLA